MKTDFPRFEMETEVVSEMANYGFFSVYLTDIFSDLSVSSENVRVVRSLQFL